MLKRVIISFIIGFMAHMFLVELYYVNHMLKLDSCEPTRREDGSLDVDISHCIEEIDNEVPNLITSPRLYRFLKYKRIEATK